jgi:type II secretory pathway pseudopilin PulG
MIKTLLHNKARGDTIIEVMFAVAVGGLTIVLALAVMNRGVAVAQMTAENTFVRQYVDGQAEALRYFHDAARDGVCLDSYSQATKNKTPACAWPVITSKVHTGKAEDFGEQGCDNVQGGGSGALGSLFYVQLPTSSSLDVGASSIKSYASVSKMNNLDPFARPSNNGFWIEAIEPTDKSFIDFHINSCWEPPYSGPNATLGTIVRLNNVEQ